MARSCPRGQRALRQAQGVDRNIVSFGTHLQLGHPEPGRPGLLGKPAVVGSSLSSTPVARWALVQSGGA
jgi:hypothetical protein